MTACIDLDTVCTLNGWLRDVVCSLNGWVLDGLTVCMDSDILHGVNRTFRDGVTVHRFRHGVSFCMDSDALWLCMDSDMLFSKMKGLRMR